MIENTTKNFIDGERSKCQDAPAAEQSSSIFVLKMW